MATNKGRKGKQVSYLPVLILNIDKKAKQEMVVQVFEKFTVH